jgi:hypothetical protein
MDKTLSRSNLLDFLDFLRKKGMINSSTASSRKAAVNTLLSILSPEEAADLGKINFDDVAVRFSHLKGSDFKPDSIKVYKSRVYNSLEDLRRYIKDPVNFRPVTSSQQSSNNKAERNDSPPAHKKKADPMPLTPTDVVFPIPIRPDCVIKVVGIPSDLTPQEATKIGKVIAALAQQ